MKKFSGGFGGYEFASNQIQFGKQEGMEGKWREIIAIEDQTLRNQAVDQLLQTMEQNKEQNGFFGKTDEVEINTLFSQRFCIDDNELYYQFFNNLKNNMQNNTENRSSGWVVLKSILQTEQDYLGFPSNDERKRAQVASVFISDEDVVIPSIRNFKGQNCAACVEFASISHNLWLLTGVTSYYVVSKNIRIDGESGGHAYNLVEYGNKFRLCDIAQGNYTPLEGNPIEAILNEQPFMVGESVYANANHLEPTIK